MMTHSKGCKIHKWPHLAKEPGLEKANCTCVAVVRKFDGDPLSVGLPHDDKVEAIFHTTPGLQIPASEGGFIRWAARRIIVLLFWLCKYNLWHDWTWSLAVPSKEVCARCKKRRDVSRKQ